MLEEANFEEGHTKTLAVEDIEPAIFKETPRSLDCV
jgi:hypothetical protein